MVPNNQRRVCPTTSGMVAKQPNEAPGLARPKGCCLRAAGPEGVGFRIEGWGVEGLEFRVRGLRVQGRTGGVRMWWQPRGLRVKGHRFRRYNV